jgi:hypothetical protein
MCVCAVKQGIFRKDLNMPAFCRLFFRDHDDILSNQRVRWQNFLKAARNGRLTSRPSVKPTWKPHKVYHPPMIGVLQSSYADVKHEMNVMCEQHLDDFILFVAGDGLAVTCVNWLLASEPEIYLDSTPAMNYDSHPRCVILSY